MFRCFNTCFCILFFWGCAASEAPLRLGAAASLGDVLPPLLARAESRLERPIEAIYGGSGELVAQLRHGAPLDLLFLASDEPIRMLIEDGLMEDIGGPRIANRLVLVGQSLAPESTLDQILQNAERVGIGSRGVPCGDVARSWLIDESIELDNAVEFSHVRAVLACIEAQSCDVGFVYETDLNGRANFHVHAKREIASNYGFGARLNAPEGAQELADFLSDSVLEFEKIGFERSSS